MTNRWDAQPDHARSLRSVVEEWLTANGWEQSEVDRSGVIGWFAPDAGYSDGIGTLTTQEAVAAALRSGGER